MTQTYRTIRVADYILDTKCTIREAAKHLGLSKTTVHRLITDKELWYGLYRLSPSRYEAVRKHLAANGKKAHIRGGEVTKRRYARALQTGTRVKFIDEQAHEASPEYYPSVGTIGIVETPGDPPFIQWPVGTTSYFDRWYCDRKRLKVLR